MQGIDLNLDHGLIEKHCGQHCDINVSYHIDHPSTHFKGLFLLTKDFLVQFTPVLLQVKVHTGLDS